MSDKTDLPGDITPNDEIKRIVIEFEPAAAELVDRVRREVTAAQKSGETTRLNTLRLLKAAIDNLSIARTDPKRSDYQKPVTAPDLYNIIDQQRKAREEAAI